MSKSPACKLAVVCAVLLASTTANALDLSGFVADTISAHPQVKEKLHVFREAVSDQQLAKSGYRPSIDLDANTGIYNTNSPATGNQSRDYNSSRIELSVTQNLFSGYDTDNQIEQNKFRASSALYDIYDTADNIALDAIQAYLEVLKQQRLLELATENVNSHEGILSQIRERNNSGVGRASQLQQTEGRVARAHASLIAQQNNLQDALTLLHQILGRYVTPDELTEPQLPELPPDDLNTLIDEALQNHPAMKVAQKNIAASRSDYKRSRRTRYPNIDLRLGSKWGDNIGGFDGETKELSLTLNLTYNFYNGGADKANQQKKISIVHERKEFAARVRRQIINTLRLSWVADESLSRQLVYLKQHIEKSRQTVASYREEFFIGQRDLIDLLDAENELNTARNSYTKAYYDAMAARYRVFESIGQLFTALDLETQMSADDFKVARLEAKKVDKLPLPTDEDSDQELDSSDHCDNSLGDSVVNVYGCQQAADVEMGYVHINTPPSLGNDEVEVDAGSILAISKSELMSNDTDVDGDVLTMVDVGRPNNGRLAFNKDKSLIYRPAEGFSGVDSFTYTVSDGNGAASTATVQINVRKADGIDLSKMQYVNFQYDKTDLTNISAKKVKKIIQRIREADDLDIEIRAYTDSIGSNAYNLDLSRRRANALKKLLIKQGIPASSITAIGKGEADPIADNATKAGQAINRRGEFVFKAKGIAQ
jgi:adhesin transport system outer membrane protein